MMSSIVELDGRDVGRRHRVTADVVVVGSGPAGATVARTLALRGVEVLVLEEGHEAPPDRFVASGVRAMAALYRDMGTSLAYGRCSMPYLQGCCVGGTSVINGAICWRMPREVLEGWARDDAAVGQSLRPDRIEQLEIELETRLSVRPTSAAIAGDKNLLLGKGADRLGLEHRAIRRNVDGCVGEGRCLQGCPHGHKLSMDRAFLPDAVAAGARIQSGMCVNRIVVERDAAVGVVGITAGGANFEATARRAVVLAASAIQTPVLLLASGLGHGRAGRDLSAHPGVSVTARFPHAVRSWKGATQGHEVTGLRSEGIKIEALGFDLSILASRVPGVGRDFARRVEQLDRYAVWGAAIRASGRGRVRQGPGRPLVTFSLSDDDVRRTRRAVRVMGELFLAAGADEVYPGVRGFDSVVRDRSRMAAFEQEGPLDAAAYAMSMTHLFGTARMGSDSSRCVVRSDFRHHAVERLYLADSSVFPSNIGVNPQIPIMALAALCADRVR